MQLSLPLTGSVLSARYQLGRVLGEGASSVVFAARDLRLERDVAVKVLKPQVVMHAEERRARFLAEARTLAQLTHPHIVPIFDVGETADGVAYFVMELVGDRSLFTELELRSTLPVEEALALLLPMMGALALAHDRGVVHRDLKPGNVVLEVRRGSTTRAKLLDFGIAKHADLQASSGGLLGTGSGLALGTPGYMSPEQASGGHVGPQSDVWSMGVLFFRCLAGRLPFDAPNATGVLLKVVHDRAPRFQEACPTLGRHLAVALDRALEPDPAARPRGMREFARSLAVACRQDGVRLPSDPDPIGLPEFAQWVAHADVESTARAVAVSRPSSQPPPDEGSTLASVSLHRAPPRSRARWAVAAGMAVALSGLALSSTPAKPQERALTEPAADLERAHAKLNSPPAKLNSAPSSGAGFERGAVEPSGAPTPATLVDAIHAPASATDSERAPADVRGAPATAALDNTVHDVADNAAPNVADRAAPPMSHHEHDDDSEPRAEPHRLSAPSLRAQSTEHASDAPPARPDARERVRNSSSVPAKASTKTQPTAPRGAARTAPAAPSEANRPADLVRQWDW